MSSPEGTYYFKERNNMKIEIRFEGHIGLEKDKEGDEKMDLSKSIGKINVERESVTGSSLRPQTRGATNVFSRENFMGINEEVKEEFDLDNQTVPLDILQHQFAKTNLGDDVVNREDKYRITDLNPMPQFRGKEGTSQDVNDTALLVSKYISQTKLHDISTTAKFPYQDHLDYVYIYIYII